MGENESDEKKTFFFIRAHLYTLKKNASFFIHFSHFAKISVFFTLQIGK